MFFDTLLVNIKLCVGGHFFFYPLIFPTASAEIKEEVGHLEQRTGQKSCAIGSSAPGWLSRCVYNSVCSYGWHVWVPSASCRDSGWRAHTHTHTSICTGPSPCTLATILPLVSGWELLCRRERQTESLSAKNQIIK